MKSFLAILGGGLVLFIVAAMAQEWEVFASAWFREPAAATRPAETPEVREATGTVRRFLSLLSHLHGTGGDPRFAERLPATETIVGEVMADIEFARHRGQREEPELVRLEVARAAPAGEGRVEVHTKEYWVVRAYRLEGEEAVGPAASQILHGKYLVRLDGTVWRVAAWDIEAPPEPAPSPQPPPAAGTGG